MPALIAAVVWPDWLVDFLLVRPRYVIGMVLMLERACSVLLATGVAMLIWKLFDPVKAWPHSGVLWPLPVLLSDPSVMDRAAVLPSLALLLVLFLFPTFATWWMAKSPSGS